MGFRDLMNNYYYGKQGKADMTVADLPANRRQLFGTVLKVRWTQMIGVNLLYLIFWIPAIIWTIMNLMLLNSAQVTDAGAFTRADVLSVISTWLMIMIPCIAITGPFNAGVTYVLRNWARDQHSFILSDFKDAVKGNWKQALPVSLISGLMPFVVFMAVQFYGEMAKSSPLFMIPIALVILMGAVWSMATMLMYVMMVTYTLRLRDIIRNSILLTVGKLPYAVLFKLLTLLLPILGLVVSEIAPASMGYVVLALCILYVLIMPTFTKLLTVSYANWLCETYMNPKIEGAQTNIGLRPENWDDTEYRPEDDE